MSSNIPINWRRKDYGNLIKAVNRFNKNVRTLEAENPGMRVPEAVTYQEIKNNIYSRKEYNRIINSLDRLSKESQQKFTTTEGGVTLTKWELNEINRNKRRAERRLTSELISKEATTSLGTGNPRVNEIKATLKSYDKLLTSDSEAFDRISKSIMHQGTSDYELKKATIFQQNFITAYKKMKRKEIVDIAKRFKNPMDFWEFINDSEFIEIQEKYEEDQGLVQFGTLTKDENYYLALEKVLEKLKNMEL